MASLLDKIKRKKKDAPKKEVVKDAKVLDVKEDKKEAPKKSQAKKTEKKAETPKKEVAKPVALKKGSRAYEVLVKPHISEKAAYGEQNGQYTFVVKRDASKVDIKNAVREIYGILPSRVRVIHMDGKRVRFGARKGRRKDWKKAIVTLPKGKSIDIHAGV